MIELSEEHQRLVFEYREKSGLSLQKSRKVILKTVVKQKIDQIRDMDYPVSGWNDPEAQQQELIESAFYDIADVLETILEEFK